MRKRRKKRDKRENYGNVQFSDDGCPIGFCPAESSVPYRLRDVSVLEELKQKGEVSPEDYQRAVRWFRHNILRRGEY